VTLDTSKYKDGDVIIRYKGVYKAFDDLSVYEDLNLEVKKGETVSIMGGSGSGKTVALKMLVGLLTPDKGEISVFDQSVVGFKESEWQPIRQKVSLLFQSNALFDSLDVRDNMAYPLKIKDPKIKDDEIDRLVHEKLSLVGLPGIEHKKPSDLSGGMQKRVGLARAIVTEPDVILWDEPTTGLDPINANRIGHLINRMKQVLGCTSIVVTHDIGTAFSVSDRISFLFNKRLILTDTTENVRNTDVPEVKNFLEGRFEGLYEE